MTRWLLACCAALAACGDDGLRRPVWTPTSGTQLALGYYRYDDGTELPDPGALYDKRVHTPCTPQTWIDGTLRCVPVADEALYTDAECTMLVGRRATIDKPTHFVAYELVGPDVVPARVFEAGADTDPVAEVFYRVDGSCMGPYPAPEGPFMAVGAEVDGTALAELHDGEEGGGRLARTVRESADGLRQLVGFRDRELELACTPREQLDGTVACTPDEATRADYFADPACTQPAVAVSAEGPAPAVAEVVEPSGCSSYRAIGGELDQTMYRQIGDACLPTTILGRRAFAVGAPLDLATLPATPDAVGRRRLQRVILGDDDDAFYAAQPLDTATRTACAPTQLGDATRCLPVALAHGVTLFAAGCQREIPVVALPRRSCERPAFAVLGDTDGKAVSIHAIGALATDTLFISAAGGCFRYTAPPDTDVHALGPALDPSTFERAIRFNAR